jgi:predicted extracellular nuclease
LQKIFLFFIITIFCNASNFKLATYNVQNLFDLEYGGYEYRDYKPYTKLKWNKNNYDIKLKNISKVLNDLDADIIALQEIENKNVLKDLLLLTNYKYSYISTKKTTTVKTAILSRFPIIKTKQIKVSNRAGVRDIIKVTVSISGKKLSIFVNHWKSKRSPESSRIAYAKALKRAIKNMNSNEYLLVGDFNSNYNEMDTIKNNPKLNNSNGITGINHILNSIDANNLLITKNSLTSSSHYNLWLELKKDNRFSYIYRKKHNTLDNILIPKTLIDNKNIDFVSFGVFNKKYLFYKKNVINRWYQKRGVHIGKGYSDHLPIYAIFKIIR